MNVKVGSVLKHRSNYSHPGLVVLTLEDAPDAHKRTRVLILDIDGDYLSSGEVVSLRLRPEDWKKIT